MVEVEGNNNNNKNAAVMVQYVRQRRIEVLYGAKVLRNGKDFNLIIYFYQL